MAIKDVRCIFFDLDDTLYDAEGLYLVALRHVWKRWCRYKPETWPVFRRRYLAARAHVKERLGDVPSARNRLLYFKAMVEKTFGSAYADLSLELASFYEKPISKINWKPVKPLLMNLRKKYRLGIITNQQTHFQLSKLKNLDGNGQLFQSITTSEEAGVEKPHPAIYRLACQQLRCVPKNALMVGNSWKDDVQGALKAGYAAAFFDPTSASRVHNARLIQIQKISDLPKLLSIA